jgi:hypothetical protein
MLFLEIKIGILITIVISIGITVTINRTITSGPIVEKRDRQTLTGP